MEEFAAAEVERLRIAGKRIPGLGHPVFKRVDPRAAMLRQVAVEEGCWTPTALLYEQIHAAFTRLRGKSEICINDVGMMAMVLVALGFTPEERTGLAILSTVPGLIAHISEELAARRPIRVVPREQVTYDLQPGRDLGADQMNAGWTTSWQPVDGVAP